MIRYKIFGGSETCIVTVISTELKEIHFKYVKSSSRNLWIFPSPRVYKKPTHFLYLVRGSSTRWHPLAHQKQSVKDQSSLKVQFAHRWRETYLSGFPLHLAPWRGRNLQLQLCQPGQKCWGINSCSLFPSSHHYKQKLSNICINSLLPIYYPGEAELIKYQPQTANSFSMREIVKNHILPLTSHAVPEELS